MRMKNLIGAAAVGALAISPVAANTGSAKRLSLTKSEESKLGGSTAWAAALIAVVIGIVVVASGKDAPTSP
ncbi:MAG: hypothetical protein RL481_548 [Pseudomonadota bacterium]